MGITLAFEQSLQAVNPAVSLAYWDFTIDKYHFDTGNWSSLKESPLWTDEWFGEAGGTDERASG